MTRALIPTLALPFLALAAAAPAQELHGRVDAVRPDAPALAGFGPLGVGVRTLELTDPGRVDVLNASETETPTYDRPLTVEVWYPAADGIEAGTVYETVLRDGETPVRLGGRATRDAAVAEDGPYPLVLISHGYPGNRFLMAHLGETLASRGYVVASIGHTDSSYSDQAAFGSTLYNRPWDQKFVLERMAALDDDLGAITDADTAAVVGYSMGGYGALIFAGAGVTAASVGFDFAPPAGLLAANQAGSESHAGLPDERIKAVVAIGPWGRNTGFWDAEGLAAIDTPLLLIAGGADDVSEYPAIRQIFDETTGTERHLLTFEAANHNAGAPIPAPSKSWEVSESLGWAPFEHYADAVWDSVRMNNVAQHFVAAFLDLHLKGLETRGYLDLIEVASEGIVARDEAGEPLPEHSYWAGFPDRTAVGLRFESRAAGE